MTLEQELAQLGLKEHEVQVYLAILELGEPSVGDIEKQINLHKQLIYNAASSLQEKSLISIHEIRGRKRFSVSNPAALEENAHARLRKAQELVPLLFDRANKKREADKVRTYRNTKGVQQYYLDSIRYERFEHTRLERRIALHLLLFGSEEKEIDLNKGRSHLDLRLFEETIQGPMDIMIWHDHVGMLFYGEEPYILDIIGQQTVVGFKNYFAIMWKQATPVNTIA